MFEDCKGGVFGDWSSEVRDESWHVNDGKISLQKDKEEFEKKIKEARGKMQSEREKEQKIAAEKANKIWEKSKQVKRHPYLDKKQVDACGIRLYEDSLVLSLCYEKEIVSIQFISENGKKRFLSGGRVKGCSFSIGDIENPKKICLTEGFATGSTVHKATGFPVLVAFSCNNLRYVAKMAREKYPDADLVICADDDFQTEKNFGLSKAKDAALTAKVKVAIPKFDKDRPEWAKDFNDMAVLHGHDLVRQAISNASYPKWPNPLNLSEDYPEAEFPLDMFPEKIRLAIEEVACFVKAPMPLVASSALGALSLAIQAHVDVARDKKLIGPCSLFMLTIAESGERKTASDKYFTRSIRDYEKEQMVKMKPELATYEAECATIKAQRQGIELEIKRLAKDNDAQENINELQKKIAPIGNGSSAKSQNSSFGLQ